jgi:hypothetical protein
MDLAKAAGRITEPMNSPRAFDSSFISRCVQPAMTPVSRMNEMALLFR